MLHGVGENIVTLYITLWDQNTKDHMKLYVGELDCQNFATMHTMLIGSIHHWYIMEGRLIIEKLLNNYCCVVHEQLHVTFLIISPRFARLKLHAFKHNLVYMKNHSPYSLMLHSNNFYPGIWFVVREPCIQNPLHDFTS